MWISKQELVDLNKKIYDLENRIDAFENSNNNKIVLDPGRPLMYSRPIEWMGREEISIKEAIRKILDYLKLEFKIVPEKTKEYKLMKKKK